MERLESIVVAHDLSKGADRALARGLQLAGRNGRVCLVHVIARNEDPPAARRELDVRLSSDSGWTPSDCRVAVVETGDPIEVVSRQSRSCRAQLVVLGMHRKRGLLDLVSTITSVRIVQNARIPVLIAVRGLARPYKRVLVAVDEGECAAEALRAAVAWFADAAILAVHAFELPKEQTLDPTSIENIDRSRRLWMTYFLRRSLEDGEALAFEAIEQVLIHGPPIVAIRAAALEKQADLVVLGTHARPVLSGLFLGSVARSLLSDPPTDLLVVPPPDDRSSQ